MQLARSYAKQPSPTVFLIIEAPIMMIAGNSGTRMESQNGGSSSAGLRSAGFITLPSGMSSRPGMKWHSKRPEQISVGIVTIRPKM